MAEKHRPSRWQIGVAFGIAVLVLCLQVFGIHSLWRSSGRVVGVYFGSEAEQLVVTDLVSGGPAEQALFERGDRIVSINGYELRTADDYEIPAAKLLRGEPARFVVERDGRNVELTVRPGLVLHWTSLAFQIFVLLLCLSLGLLTLSSSGGDLQGRLLAWFFFLLAFEFSLFQSQASYERNVYLLAEVFFYLGTGAQFAVEMHLVSLIPQRQPWLRRVGWAVPLFYVVGLGLGLATAAAYALQMLEAPQLPWTYNQAYWLLMEVGLPVWATAILVLLAIPALRHADAEGRQQALLILMGLLPWIVYVYYTTGLSLAGQDIPNWLNEFFPLIVLFFPIAVFIAIYRYQLFDIELVVRRSLLYTALTGVLVTVFYLLVGGLGLLTSRVVGEARYSIWAVAAAMFFVGLLFANVRAALQNLIDRLFFPERQALRQRLVELSAELPSRGTVSGMGAHLVERLSEIFGVSRATLFLTDPKRELFLLVASHPRPSGDSPTLSSLVPAKDPVLERLREQAGSLPAEGLLEKSPTLSRHFPADEPEAAQTLVPLLARHKLIGFLVLGEPEPKRPLRREEMDLLNLLALHIGTSFENIRLFESATYESLTGLMRRGSALELLDREIERAQRYGRPLVTGMADLDFFKSVNDRYGHLAGDAVLKRVADELKAGLRSTDAIGRYGGEEFLLVLPETHLEGGLAVAEKLRRRIESLELPMTDGTTIGPRISIGLASLDDLGDDLDRETTRRVLLETADRALYRAKERGRNRVETLEGPVARVREA